jgi:uncharacterized oligopeptide transporter (OPT) family protein
MAKGFVVLLTLGIAVVALGQTSADLSAKLPSGYFLRTAPRRRDDAQICGRWPGM